MSAPVIFNGTNARFLTSTASANNFIEGYATTATAAGTTTLTNISPYQQFFSGATTQTVVLPVASTMTLGQAFLIVNNSSGVVTVNSSGANLVVAIPANSSVAITCILTSGTSAASWDAKLVAAASTIRSELQFYTYAGLGSSSTVIPYFATTSRNTGSDITFVNNSTVGLVCTIATTGLYYVSFSYDPGANTISECGISLNSSQLTTALDAINAADRLAYAAATAIAAVVVDFNTSWAGLLTAGDVIRPHTNGAPGGTRAFFKIVKIGN